MASGTKVGNNKQKLHKPTSSQKLGPLDKLKDINKKEKTTPASIIPDPQIPPVKPSIGQRCLTVIKKCISRKTTTAAVTQSQTTTKKKDCFWTTKIGYYYRHPISRMFNLAILFIFNILSYGEDPIYYSQKSASVPIIGLALNHLALSYVNPVEFPKYFAFQLVMVIFPTIIFVFLGEVIIRRWILQRLFNLRGFKYDKGNILLGLIWATLGLWFSATLINYLVSIKLDHTWSGFFDYILDDNSDSNIEFSGTNSSNSNNNSGNYSQHEDNVFNFLKWMGVIDFRSNDRAQNQQQVTYLTKLNIMDDLPLSNELFCRIARNLVIFSDLFTFFSILDMIMQDRTHYKFCCYKAKKTECWSKTRIPLFWTYILIVTLIILITSGLSIGWYGDWKGYAVPLNNATTTEEYPTLAGKEDVIISLDNQGQKIAERYTMFDKMYWKQGSNQISSTTVFTDFIRNFELNDSQSLYLWLSPEDLEDQRIIGTYTQNIMEGYQSGQLVNLESNIAQNQTILEKNSLRPLIEAKKFPPLESSSPTWMKNRGYFYTTERERIYIKTMVLILGVIILHQDPEFPHFEEQKSKKKKRQSKTKLVGFDGTELNQTTFWQTIATCFPCFKFKWTKEYMLRKMEAKSKKEDDYDNHDFLSDSEILDSSSNSSDDATLPHYDYRQEDFYFDTTGEKRDFRCKTFFQNAIDAFNSCLPLIGLKPNQTEEQSPYLNSFGGEHTRYRFNKSPIARICCSCCNAKPKKSHEMAKTIAKNYCCHKWKSWLCCLKNRSVKKEQFDIAESFNGNNESKHCVWIEKCHSSSKKPIKKKKNTPFVTALWLVWSVFLIALLLDALDLFQQITYDPTSYNQIVDSENRVHSLFPIGGFDILPSSKEIIFSALYIMAPTKVSFIAISNQTATTDYFDHKEVELWSALNKENSVILHNPESYPQEYSWNYGKEPYVKYKEKQVVWNTKIGDFAQNYIELMLADGTVQKNPLGMDYALEVLINFVTDDKKADFQSNITHLKILQDSVSKRIEWLYLYEPNSNKVHDVKTFIIDHCDKNEVNDTDSEEKQIIYKLYGVSCKCWKLPSFTTQGLEESEKLNIDGIYVLNEHQSKTRSGKTFLKPKWENNLVKTMENKLSSLKFQKIGTNLEYSENPNDLEDIQKCKIASDTPNFDPTIDFDASFLTTNKQDFEASYLSSNNRPLCSSLEVHTLVVKKKNLQRLINKAYGAASNGIPLFLNGTDHCVNPFHNTKWLEHCHKYHDNLDVRCGPCYQSEYMDFVSTKKYLSCLLRNNQNKDSCIDFLSSEEDSFYRTTKKRLSYVVDLWEETDFENKSQPNFKRDLGFWFGHEGQILSVSEGYQPSSDSMYADEELPILLTQKFNPVLTLGPLNIKYTYMPLQEKLLISIIPAICVIFVFAKIISSFVYRALKKWERKLKDKVKYHNKQHDLKKNTPKENKYSKDGDFDLILLDGEEYSEEEQSEEKATSNIKSNFGWKGNKKQFFRCKLTLLFCCRKIHGSRQKTMRPNEVEYIFGEETQQSSEFSRSNRIVGGFKHIFSKFSKTSSRYEVQ